MIAMIGTSDRLCWLAETCKILLLLLQPSKAELSEACKPANRQHESSFDWADLLDAAIHFLTEGFVFTWQYDPRQFLQNIDLQSYTGARSYAQAKWSQ